MRLTLNTQLLFSGDRGVKGPPGEKPQIPLHIIVDMKGVKGEHGPLGDPGFPGPRGL